MSNRRKRKRNGVPPTVQGDAHRGRPASAWISLTSGGWEVQRSHSYPDHPAQRGTKRACFCCKQSLPMSHRSDGKLSSSSAKCSLWPHSGEVPAGATSATGRSRVWLSRHPNSQVAPACLPRAVLRGWQAWSPTPYGPLSVTVAAQLGQASP